MRQLITSGIFLFLLLTVTVITTRTAGAEDLPNCGDYQADDLISLACNIYWEGRNQSRHGMLAIAAATLHRTEDPEFPDTVAGVVWEKRWSKKYNRYYPQFSWTLDGKKDIPFKNEQEVWEYALRLARIFTIDSSHKARICPQIAATGKMWDILEKRGVPVTRRPVRCGAYELLMASKMAILDKIDPTGGSVMYHASYVKPAWRKSFDFVCQVDDHLFYRKDD